MSVETIYPPPSHLRSSIELGQLFTALSLAQGEMTDPVKNKLAKVTMKSGGQYTYKYSDLADLFKIIRPVFAKHGLCLIQFPVNPHQGSVTIVTRIGHKSGQWIEGDLTMLVPDDKPQTLGSTITYGRRYSAGGVAGSSPDEDEDAQLAQEQSPDKPKPRGPRAKQEPAKAPPIIGGYDPQNRAHQDKLMTQLRERKIPEDRWDDVGEAMRGRPSSDLEQVINELELL